MSLASSAFRGREIRIVLALIVLGALIGTSPGEAFAQAPWSFAGGDIYGRHAALSPVGPNQLRASTLPRLQVIWSFQASGDIAATPTVEAGAAGQPAALYVPDWGPATGGGGMLYKLNADTGAVIWSHAVSDYTGAAGSKSRTSPAIGALGEIIVSDQGWGSRVMSIDRTTGGLNWLQRLDRNVHATISAPAMIYRGLIYVTTSSWEETSTNTPPSFRGKVLALDEATGAIVWSFDTVPPGYTGGASVGGGAIWPPGNALIVTTDNNYTIPDIASQCLLAVGAGADVPTRLGCLDPTDYVDAVLSLDLTTGGLNWARRMEGGDTWNKACNVAPYAGCPVPAGGDFDFASGPNVTPVRDFIGVVDDKGGTSQNWIVGAGEKNGIYWGMNPVNGGLFWSTLVGRGGIQWGSAINTSDYSAVYVALNNNTGAVNTLAGRNGVPMDWKGGAWAALDLRTGRKIWQIPASGQDLRKPNLPARAPGSMAFSNYLVFAGSSSGDMVALGATNGYTHWTFHSGGTVVLHPAIYNDRLFWGTGYGRAGVSNPVLFAFGITPEDERTQRAK